MTAELNLQALQPPPLESYEYSHRIAVGGMAEIFLAWQKGPGGFRRPVAVKHALPQFTADHDFVELLLREAHIAADLSHPNIVSVLEVLNPGGRECVIVMEYVHGPTLRGLLSAASKKRVAIPLDVTVHAIASVCAALDYAHNGVRVGGDPRRLVHRDVTPTNILLSASSGNVKLGDFGIARSYSAESVTRSGVIMGKAAYMSPEQIRGEQLDQRSDLFSVGVVLYEMLTGVQPFWWPGGDAAVAQAVLTDPIPDPRAHVPGLSADLTRIVQRSLAREREDRYESAAQMAADLRAAVGTSPADGARGLVALVQRLFPDLEAKPEAVVREEDAVPSVVPTVVVTRSRRYAGTAQAASISVAVPQTPPVTLVRRGSRVGVLVLVGLAVISAIVWWILIAGAR